MSSIYREQPVNSSAEVRANVRKDTKALLDTVGIYRVVIVDDEYAVNVGELLGICSELALADSKRLPHLQEVQFDAPRELWAGQIRQVWETLDHGERRHVLAQARELNAASVEGEAGEERPADDYKAAMSLEEVLQGHAGLELVLLSLSEWREQGANLLVDVKAKNTLLFFDRDFSREEAGAENEGLKQIRDVQSKNVGYCGLITHTIPLEDEYEAWIRLSEQHGIAPDKFIIVAKERLNKESPDFYGFLSMLRVAALSGRYARVKSRAWSIFENSLSEARKGMERLSVLDFDRVVFASSRNEGVWEPDTLFRVFGILMRRKARSLLLEDDEIADAVEAARSVSAAPERITRALEAHKDSNEALRIQRFEIYDAGNELNVFHAPIDLGDIFEFGLSEKHYILLAQPCDLIVRKNGMRNHEDNRFGRTAALVELVLGTVEKRESWGQLPFYEEKTGESAFANFAKVRHVPLAVLDLCTVRSDGSAGIDVSAGRPNLLIEPWKVRHGKLCKYFEKALVQYEKLRNAAFDDEIASCTLPGSSTALKLGPAVNGSTIQYKVKRNLRLRQPRSGALLTEFAQYQARAAFEHHFGHRPNLLPGTDNDQASQ